MSEEAKTDKFVYDSMDAQKAATEERATMEAQIEDLTMRLQRMIRENQELASDLQREMQQTRTLKEVITMQAVWIMKMKKNMEDEADD